MVHLTNDLRYLLRGVDYEKLPEIDQNELVDSWMNIQNEWSEVTGNNQADLSLLRKKLMAQLKHAFDYQIILYNAVLEVPMPELVELFNSCGFKVDLNNYEESMQRAYGKLMKKKAQIELEEGNEDNDKEPIDFEELIVLLESVHTFTENERTMTVRKFAKIYKKVIQDARRKDNKK
jgi:hypothetical protein